MYFNSFVCISAPARGLNTSLLNVTTPSQRAKFDLKESLSRPVTWKAYSGRIKPLAESNPFRQDVKEVHSHAKSVSLNHRLTIMLQKLLVFAKILFLDDDNNFSAVLKMLIRLFETRVQSHSLLWQKTRISLGLFLGGFKFSLLYVFYKPEIDCWVLDCCREHLRRDVNKSQVSRREEMLLKKRGIKR